MSVCARRRKKRAAHRGAYAPRMGLKVNWTISLVPSTPPDHQTRAVVVVVEGWPTTPRPAPASPLAGPPSPRPRVDVLTKMSVAVRLARGRLSLAEEKDGRDVEQGEGR